MKLVLIGKFNEVYHEEGKARGFQELGCEVYRFEERTFDASDREIIANKIKPDAIIYTKLSFKDPLGTILYFKKYNIKLISWYPDYCNVGEWENSAFNIKNIKKCPMSKSDLVLIPDSTNKDRWASLGINQQLMRQAISKEFCYVSPPKEEWESDIIFIGSLVNNSLYNYRYKLVDFLNKNYGSKFLHLGSNNPYQIRNSELNTLISSTKIVICDSVFAKGYWSNRIYESMGRGGFCLHSYTEGLENDFIIGEHLDTYKHDNYIDLKQKIDYYLNNSKLRKKIAKKGFTFIKENHTITHRCLEVINKIKNL
jgi:spore maturation protein CgeB